MNEIIFMGNRLLALRNGFKSIAANNWMISFEISVIISLVAVFYFGIRILLFVSGEKRLGADKIEIFTKRSPSLDLSKVNESDDGRFLPPSARFFVSSSYSDQKATVTKEKFLSLFGNVITVEYTESRYTVNFQTPLGFYILFFPFLIPFIYLFWTIITTFSFGQTIFPTTELLRACFFSPVFTMFFAGFITIVEGAD